MACPFLEEIVVRYCKACPVKKLIPQNDSGTPSICLMEKYVECPTYREVALAEESRNEEVVQVQPRQTEERGETTIERKECIWMKLGVVSYRMCLLNYDCQNCEFNQMLMDANSQYQEAPGVLSALQSLQKLPAEERKCRYMLTGDVSYKLCAHNYDCATCEYDQRMQDAIDFHPRTMARRTAKARREKVKGFFIPDDLYFSTNHMWVRVEKDGRVKVGVDDFAQKLLGRIDQVSLPKRDERTTHEDDCWTVRSGRRVAHLSTPLNGTIDRVNHRLLSRAGLIHEEPYDGGWLFSMKPDDLEHSLEGLLRGSKARSWLEKEVDRLSMRVEEELGATIADGGSISDKLSDEEWNRVVKEFLR